MEAWEPTDTVVTAPEPKLRLVQMYLNGGASLNGLAQEHDISCNLIRAWADKFHKGELSE